MGGRRLTKTQTGTQSCVDHQVGRVPKAVNPNKAAGPDEVLGKVFCACADPLTEVEVLTGFLNSVIG
ncbi:hypothetical protein ILYODFUR_038062 [Ilyodon furcidens]|uniref:Uncharacterized protein n=1 Tax=Ilyodon furcidens TaxID=33524 RepID=A0ABV0TUF6_9TELE